MAKFQEPTIADVNASKDRSTTFVRFSPRQRLEHLLIMVLFTVLVITGLPQKFHEAKWAEWTVMTLGGIDKTRWVHRFFGILFTLVSLEHLVAVVYLVFFRKVPPSLIPTGKDFTDAVMMLRYYLGLSEQHPQFDRFDYRQKFEYWGLVFGGVIMIVTGFILYFPIQVTRILPGVVIPAAKMAHSSEALLAFLVIVTWHMYSAHLNPDVFPFDSSIFTGRVSLERMLKEHPLEHARMIGKEAHETNGGVSLGPGLSESAQDFEKKLSPP